ncbi:MAG: SAM-dependent methyltransferase, partial [Flavobacteriales bacterium]
HLPTGQFNPNIDIISGQGIRLKKKSGIDLLSPPFLLKVKNKKDLLSIELPNNKGQIKTVLYNMF